MAIKSVRPVYQIGDLVGFTVNDTDDFVTEFGSVVKSYRNGEFMIKWDDGMMSTSLPLTLDVGDRSNWPNLGRDTPENRLFASLKYLKKA